MKRFFRALAAIAVAVTAGALVTGCSNNSDLTPGPPIKVALVESETSGANFPEMAQAADAVFQEYNKLGGLNGQPIELRVYGDKGSERGALAAANTAMSERNIAFIGSSSLYDGANAAFYQRQGVAVVDYCSEPQCFQSPVMAPVNAGPYYETFADLVYATQQQKQNSMCGVLFADSAPALASYASAIAQWTATTGKTFSSFTDLSRSEKPNFPQLVASLNDNKCTGIWTNADPATMLAFMKAAEIKFYKQFKFFGLSSLYTDQVLASLTWVGSGLYVPANFTPYSETEDVANYGWVALMDEYRIPHSQYSQAGYLAATAFIDTLKTMGTTPVTKKSVLAAFQGQTTPVTNDLWGNPWIFGAGSAHQPNISVWPVAVLPQSLGEWLSQGPWLRLNELS